MCESESGEVRVPVVVVERTIVSVADTSAEVDFVTEVCSVLEGEADSVPDGLRDRDTVCDTVVDGDDVRVSDSCCEGEGLRVIVLDLASVCVGDDEAVLDRCGDDVNVGVADPPTLMVVDTVTDPSWLAEDVTFTVTVVGKVRLPDGLGLVSEELPLCDGEPLCCRVAEWESVVVFVACRVTRRVDVIDVDKLKWIVTDLVAE